MKLIYGVAKVEFQVGDTPSSWVGRAGSQKFLSTVRANGVAVFEVGPRNSYGLKPGKRYDGWIGIDGSIYGKKPELIPSQYEQHVPDWWEEVSASSKEVLNTRGY